MPVNINYALSVQVNGTPALATSTAVATEAYDEINVTVPAASGGSPGTLEADVQPGASAQIRFLLIGSSVLDPDLTYSVEGAGGATNVALDSVQIFTGTGMLNFLGPNPTQFNFSNNTDQPAHVRILVGRQATGGNGNGGNGS